MADFDTLEVTQQGPDRVRISGATGQPAPPDVKVCLNLLGGWRNAMTFVLTGLDIEEKAAVTLRSLERSLGGPGAFGEFAEFDARLIRSDKPDATVNVEATAQLRVTVKDPDADRVGRRFSSAATELALAGYPGCTSPPRPVRARSTASTGRPWCPPGWWSPRRSTPTAAGCRCPTSPTWKPTRPTGEVGPGS